LGLAASLAEVGTQREVATRLADAVPDVVQCDSASVLLWDPEEQALHLEAARGMAAETEATLHAARLTHSELPGLAEMIRSPQPVFLRHSHMSKRLRALLGMITGTTIAVVPITHRDIFFGVVTAAVRDDDGQLAEDEHLLERLRGMADQAATALLNARLLEQIQYQALHDGLTGLPNRLLFKDRAEHAAAKARRTLTDVALVFLDLNGFKAVNDRLGHAAGDKLLVEVARRLQQIARASDTLARLGGDEFAILLGEISDRHAVEAFTQRVIGAIEQPCLIGNGHVAVSVSLGVAILQPDDDYDSFVHRADLAMYEAKQANSRGVGATCDKCVVADERAASVQA
jgi:diguanylate cyclase (GGDEF)-like protein